MRTCPAGIRTKPAPLPRRPQRHALGAGALREREDVRPVVLRPSSRQVVQRAIQVDLRPFHAGVLIHSTAGVEGQQHDRAPRIGECPHRRQAAARPRRDSVAPRAIRPIVSCRGQRYANSCRSAEEGKERVDGSLHDPLRRRPIIELVEQGRYVAALDALGRSAAPSSADDLKPSSTSRVKPGRRGRQSGAGRHDPTRRVGIDQRAHVL